jgi:hypothetical protein
MGNKGKLITKNAELLIYLDGKLHITVLGGIKLAGLDRLKVTLKLTVTGKPANAFRHNLDLYNSIQTEQLTEKAAEALDVSTSELSGILNSLTTALENYRAHTGRSVRYDLIRKFPRCSTCSVGHVELSDKRDL